MRKLLLLLALAAISMAAQTTQGNINAQSTDCTTTNSCVVVTLSSDAATAAVTVTGTFSATLKIEKSADNGTTWTSAGADVTSTGVTTYSIPAMSHFRVRCSGYSSGTAVVKIRASPAINSAGFSGTPGGSNTQVQFNNSGAFGGSANLTWDGATLSVTGVAPVADITSNSGGSSLRWLNTYAQTGNFSAVKVGSGTLGDTANALIQLPNNSVMVSAKKNGSGSCDIGINTSNQFTFSCPGVFSGDMLSLPTGTSDAASPMDGALWYRTDLDLYRGYQNGMVTNLSGSVVAGLTCDGTSCDTFGTWTQSSSNSATNNSLCANASGATCTNIGTSPTAFNYTFTVPANYFDIIGRGLAVTACIDRVATATIPSTWNVDFQVGTTPFFTHGTTSPSAGTALGMCITYFVNTKAAAGASVAMRVDAQLGALAPLASGTSTAQPVTGIATNGALTFRWVVTYGSAGTNENSTRLRSVYVRTM